MTKSSGRAPSVAFSTHFQETHKTGVREATQGDQGNWSGRQAIAVPGADWAGSWGNLERRHGSTDGKAAYQPR